MVTDPRKHGLFLALTVYKGVLFSVRERDPVPVPVPALTIFEGVVSWLWTETLVPVPVLTFYKGMFLGSDQGVLLRYGSIPLSTGIMVDER